MNLLFVAGPSRSGTTAFVKYLNEHPEVLICVERFKWIPREEVTPEIFTLERIMSFEEEYEKRGTESRWWVHKRFVDRKDPAKLKWMGDKFPQYTKSLDLLSENNPGASFIITYRPVEEVAESHEARSNNPDDAWLGGRDGFMIGLQNWNRDLRRAREFIESGVNPNVLIIGYHDFFYRNEACIPLISRFLDLEFDGSVQKAWRDLSRDFESKRRGKEFLTEEQRALIDKHADRETEAWILDYMKKQWEELELYSPEAARATIDERRRYAISVAEERAKEKNRPRPVRELRGRIEELEDKLEKERGKAEARQKKNRRLTRRLRTLEGQMQALQSSRAWKLLTILSLLRGKATDGARRIRASFGSSRKS
ncbi:MAG: hypothetical protein AVDCRST_MAG93-9451 [uncultured Chloroflexia bacterium]|uniref:Sulfotransferase domain-containing protein n=1 Tax=uncultured Chloroflexia bacterium TaxID=1672391 RepID=A0A6J4NEI3_9CHLR|nr:MAG: hypothetical protein AVDCRST_MAG93-9451 [uncultured Chloroflexia bacterium]